MCRALPRWHNIKAGKTVSRCQDCQATIVVTITLRLTRFPTVIFLFGFHQLSNVPLPCDASHHLDDYRITPAHKHQNINQFRTTSRLTLFVLFYRSSRCIRSGSTASICQSEPLLLRTRIWVEVKERVLHTGGCRPPRNDSCDSLQPPRVRGCFSTYPRMAREERHPWAGWKVNRPKKPKQIQSVD